jgi:hypothetical protein
VLSLVLLLGNLEFGEEEDSNGTKWSHVAKGGASGAALADAAHVARCAPAALEEALCIKSESAMLGRLPLSAVQARLPAPAPARPPARMGSRAPAGAGARGVTARAGDAGGQQPRLAREAFVRGAL